MCVDVDVSKVEGLSRGEVPIYEPGLEGLIRRNAKAGRIEFTTDAARGVERGPFQVMAVGTPPDEGGSADLRHVLAAARTIAEHVTRLCGRHEFHGTGGSADMVGREIGAQLEFGAPSLNSTWSPTRTSLRRERRSRTS